TSQAAAFHRVFRLEQDPSFRIEGVFDSAKVGTPVWRVRKLEACFQGLSHQSPGFGTLVCILHLVIRFTGSNEFMDETAITTMAKLIDCARAHTGCIDDEGHEPRHDRESSLRR